MGEMAGPHEPEFAESNVDDAWLEHLKALPDLEWFGSVVRTWQRRRGRAASGD